MPKQTSFGVKFDPFVYDSFVLPSKAIEYLVGKFLIKNLNTILN